VTNVEETRKNGIGRKRKKRKMMNKNNNIA
jgi:hypothetical protein